MKKYFAILVVAMTLGACNKEPANLVSPCVGAKGSPCERTPLNQQFLHNSNIKV